MRCLALIPRCRITVLYKEKYVMNITKRLLVLLITVSMLLSGSFVQAFAEEETVDSASVAVPETVSEEDSEDTKEAEEVKEKEEKEKEEATVEKETASSEEETPDSAEETQELQEPAESDKQDKKSEEAEDNKDAEAFTSDKLTFECDEYTVTLEYGKEAGIPDGTVLDVREISSDTDDAKEQKEYEEYYDRSLEQLRSEKGGDTIAKLGFARFYDITLVSGGKEIEPGDDVKVTFKYSKDSRESVKEGNKEGDAIRVIHMTESGKNGEIKAKPIEKKDTDLTLDKKELTEAAFTTDSFSVYGIVYTVDFEYEGYTYSILGESEIMLSDLFESLHIEESIKDVKNVEFTDYSLIKIEKTGEDWKLISLKPFSTEEKLTVTLEDKIIEIKITDDTPVAKVSSDGGITWTEHTYLINSNTQDDGVTRIGAFDQANTLSGTVTIKLLYDTHERYTLSSGFTFTGIKSLTIKGKGADNKSTLVKDQTSAPMITTKGIETVEFSNLVFDGNNKVTNGGNGGAVNTNAETLTVSNCEFNNCQAGLQGGGIYHSNNRATLTITNSQFSSCIANGTTDPNSGGGGIFSDALNLNVNNSIFNKCGANRQGAGIFHKRKQNDSISTCTVAHCTFIDCVSVHSGGGMESDAFHITVANSTFNNCKATTAEGKGGAINVYANAQAAYSGDTILNIDICKFYECTSADNGGAVRSTAVKTNISDSYFDKCTSGQNGGAIACTNNNTETAITDCNINDCHADNGSGGACFTNGKNLTVNDATVIDGCSAVNGGAIRSGNCTMNSGTISGCSAAEKGGAIHSTSQITMTGGTVTGNTTGGDSAALDAEKEKPGFYFQGDVVIKGNTGSNGEARDVYLGKDTDQHIQINRPGLGSTASIGVYVADSPGGVVFEKHGKPYTMFARTEDRVLASSLINLDKLFSDRLDNGEMHGMAVVEGSGNSRYRIMWGVVQTPVAPTNVDLQLLPYILILIGGAVLVLMKKVSDRRRKTENEGDQDA